MDRNREEARRILLLVAVCCIVMAFVETVLEPPYWVKSAVKALVFLLLPTVCARGSRVKSFGPSPAPGKKDLPRLLLLGAAVYAVVLGAYGLTRDSFDYSLLVESLSADQQVESGSFLWVALYISFGNSFLEEFLFRRIAFLRLREHIAPGWACAFSAAAFALYHVAMIGTSFPLPLLLLALIGLAAGGCIFNRADAKAGNLYPSWVIHMFADFAIMTIWFIHI